MFIKALSGSSLNEFILQEKIEGNEYTVQIISDLNNNIKSIVPVKVHITRGVTISASVQKQYDIISVCAQIHKSLPTSGVYNVQLILNSNNEAIPFEINTRISTTFCLALHAITDDPFDLYYSNTSLDNPLVEVKDGITISRHWYNYIK